MYAVVGCRECRALWIVEGRPETTRCPRCGTRRQFSKLKTFARTEDATAAREARAALLARRQDQSEAFADLDSFEELGRQAADAGPDEAAYLDAVGVDSEAVADAGDRADRGAGRGGPDRLDVVRRALVDLDDPTAEDVADYAADRDVDRAFAREALARLVRRGEASESRGVYRPL